MRREKFAPAAIGSNRPGWRETTTTPEAGTAGKDYRVAVFGGVAQYADTASA